MAKVEGNTVNVGDVVCFKSDVEQSGRIVGTKKASWGGDELVLEALGDSGFSGDYIGGDDRTTVAAEDCWIE